MDQRLLLVSVAVPATDRTPRLVGSGLFDHGGRLGWFVHVPRYVHLNPQFSNDEPVIQHGVIMAVPVIVVSVAIIIIIVSVAIIIIIIVSVAIFVIVPMSVIVALVVEASDAMAIIVVPVIVVAAAVSFIVEVLDGTVARFGDIASLYFLFRPFERIEVLKFGSNCV